MKFCTKWFWRPLALVIILIPLSELRSQVKKSAEKLGNPQVKTMVPTAATDEVKDSKVMQAFGDVINFELKNFYLDFNAGYKLSRWQPGSQKTVLTFETEGLQSLDFNFIAKYQESPFFFFNYERPVENSAKQKAIFAENKTQNPGMEKFQFGLTADALIPILGIENFFLKVLLSGRYISTRESYFGTATAVQSFAYVDIGSSVTELPRNELGQRQVSFSSLNRIPKGQKLAFKTLFKDKSLSVAWPLFQEVSLLSFLDFLTLRTGYFRVEWRRPSTLNTTWHTVVDDLLIVYDTIFKSEGYEIAFETRDRSRPGLNGNFTFRYGLRNRIQDVVGSFKVGQGKKLKYGSFLGNIWYNWYANPAKNTGLYLTLGASGDRRVFAYEFSPFGGTYNSDELYNFYLQVGFVF